MSPIEYYLITIAILGCINGIFALGFNMQFGVSGIINLAFIILVAVGAYGTAIASVGPSPGTTTSSYIGGFNWGFPWNVLFGVGCTLVFALVLGAIALRRLRHDYLALTLVAIGQGLLVFVSGDQTLLNGYTGFSGIPMPWQDTLSPSDAQLAFLGIAAFCLAVVFLVFWRVNLSPLGRALRTVRENETAALALGKNAWRLKMVGFLLGAGAAGLGGSLTVLYVGGWNTSGWQFVETLALLAAVIVGGRGRNLGALVGSVIVLEGILEATRFLPQGLGVRLDLLPELQLIAVGLLIIAFLWFRPQGVLPERKEKFAVRNAGLRQNVSQSAPPPALGAER